MFIAAAVAMWPAAAAAVGAWPVTATASAACPTGEEGDSYTGTCVPYLVPNSPDLCPAGVSGSECSSSPVQAPPTPPIARQQPEQSLEDVSTPDF